MKYWAKWADWLSEGRIGPFSTSIVFVALYCCVQIVVLTLASTVAGTGVGHDDAEQLMYMRYLWLGYGGSQPPLFSWFGWTVASIVGPGVLALKIVKYSLIFVAMVATHLTVRRLGYSQRAASAAMFGLFLFPQIVWEMQHQLSHSIAALCFSGLLILSLFELLKRRSTLAYVVFGLAAAAAILSKYNNLLLLGALLASALSIRETRGGILTPRLAISLVVAILALTPTIYRNAAHPAELMARSYKFGIGDGGNRFLVAFESVLQLANAILNFAVLPAIIFAIGFAVALIVPWARRETAPNPEKLLWRALAFGLCFTAILVVASGTTSLSDRWLLPVLFFLPMAVAITLERFDLRGRKAQNLIICAGASLTLLVMPISWFVQVYSGHGLARVVQLKYGELYRELTMDGPVRTAVSDWHWTGNLRLVDPEIIALNDEVPDFGKLIEMPAELLWLDSEAPQQRILDALNKAGYAPSGKPKLVMIPELFNSPGRRIGFVKLEKIPEAGVTP